MITAKSDPVFGGVYKLAAVKEDDGSYTPKMKLSESVEKMTIPCLKKVWRIYDEDGKAQADLITMADEVVDTKNGITLFDPIETWKECTYVNSTARCISTPVSYTHLCGPLHGPTCRWSTTGCHPYQKLRKGSVPRRTSQSFWGAKLYPAISNTF